MGIGIRMHWIREWSYVKEARDVLWGQAAGFQVCRVGRG